MPKPSNRDRILSEGLKVVHASGYAGASVRDIVAAAGVPQGSFTNHFASKEAFGLEVLELYFSRAQDRVAATLDDPDTASPLARLRNYVREVTRAVAANDVRDGCLMGNFSAEAVAASDTIRRRLVDMFGMLRGGIAACLAAAVAAGELAPARDPERLSGFILASLQGTILLAKAERSVRPLERFEAVLFEDVLAYASNLTRSPAPG